MRVRTVSAALLLALSLTACADDPAEPSTLPTLDPTARASQAAEPEANPPGMNAPTPEGAAEFARHFYAQVHEGFRTQSPELVERLSLPSCKTCANYVRSIATVRDEDLRVEGGEFEIFLAVAPEQAEASTARVDVGWNFQSVVYRNPAGDVIDQGQAVAGVEEQMDLIREGDEWRVAQITRIRQSS